MTELRCVLNSVLSLQCSVLNTQCLLFMRARLAALHGREAARWPSLFAHAAALAGVAALAYVKALPLLAVLMMFVLLARTLRLRARVALGREARGL